MSCKYMPYKIGKKWYMYMIRTRTAKQFHPQAIISRESAPTTIIYEYKSRRNTTRKGEWGTAIRSSGNKRQVRQVNITNTTLITQSWCKHKTKNWKYINIGQSNCSKVSSWWHRYMMNETANVSTDKTKSIIMQNLYSVISVSSMALYNSCNFKKKIHLSY